MNKECICIKKGKLALNTIKVIVKVDREHSDPIQVHYFTGEEEYNQWVIDFLNKHASMSVASKETLDTSAVSWVDGITLRTTNYAKEVEEILSYGSREAYEASLPSATDEYLLNLEAEIALMQLGLTGGDL